MQPPLTDFSVTISSTTTTSSSDTGTSTFVLFLWWSLLWDVYFGNGSFILGLGISLSNFILDFLFSRLLSFASLRLWYLLVLLLLIHFLVSS
jgi:hypothetical protein